MLPMSGRPGGPGGLAYFRNFLLERDFSQSPEQSKALKNAIASIVRERNAILPGEQKQESLESTDNSLLPLLVLIYRKFVYAHREDA